VIIIAAAGFAIFGLMGAVAAYVVYDKATAPDRSAPDVVVSNYLRAYLVDRDETQTNLYVCDGGSRDLGSIEALRADLLDRERRFQTPLVVKWGRLDVQEEGDSAEVRVRLIITAVVRNQTQQEVQNWRFVTRSEADWRVCGASRAD
jgi:hypothetical protein